MQKIIQDRDEEDPNVRPGGKKKIIIYEKGNVTSTID